MENNNTQYPQKEVWNNILDNGEYKGKVVKVYFQPAKQSGWSNSYRLLFLIDGLSINGVDYISFVSGFINENYKSGDKTARILQALGCDNLNGHLTKEDVDKLISKECRLYLEAGKEVWSQKLNRNVQYMQIVAVNPINRQVPSVVKTAQPKPFIQQTPVQQVPSQFRAPAPAPVQQAPAQAPVTQQGTWNSSGQPMSVNTASTLVSRPVTSPVPQQVQVPSVFNQNRQVPVQNVSPAPVQQVVEQPLPAQTFTPEELDF